MLLNEALNVFDAKYQEMISSIEYNGDPNSFKILVEAKDEDFDDYISAYIDLFDDGSYSIEYSMTSENCVIEHTSLGSKNYINVNTDFMIECINMCLIWKFNCCSKD